MENLPLFNLSGPVFLNFFGVIVFGVLVAVYVAIRFADRTAQRPPPAPPAEPDAMEVAYLQGGVNQVIRTLVYDLDQRGYAVLARGEHIAATDKAPNIDELNALELCVLDALRTRPTAQALVEDKALHAKLEELLAPVRERLAAQDFLRPASVGKWKIYMQALGVGLIVGVAGVKLQQGYAAGQNLSYLLYLAIASVASVFALGYVLTRGVASRRGLAYLDVLRVAYADRLQEAIGHIGSPGPEARAFQGASLFLIALYGFSALKGTTEAKFIETFERASGEGDD